MSSKTPAPSCSVFIRDTFVQVSVPSTQITVSGVPPFIIPDEVLENEDPPTAEVGMAVPADVSVDTVVHEPEINSVVVGADAECVDVDAVAAGFCGGEAGVQSEKRAQMDTENPSSSQPTVTELLSQRRRFLLALKAWKMSSLLKF